MVNSFYSESELKQLGLRSYGNNVFISRYARFYGPENISIGNHVRIDDFCVLSGKIELGNYIHISAFCGLYGKFGIIMEDYTGLSPRCLLFSGSDDFGGDYLISPMVPMEYTNVTGGLIHLKRFSQLGAATTILPNVVLNEGVAVGAMSLVTKSLAEWSIYAGSPLKLIKPRKKGLLKHFYKHTSEK
jgi:acetyltransferase-like isoleucine patch superfamily enzyme